MKSNSHNKKRNSILLYEFLVSSISKSLVENDKKRSSAALKILRRHYKKDTNLYREFRLLNSLLKTTVSSPQVAARILKEARDAATQIDETKLDREKSLLIRNINHSINDNSFYDQHIAEYRICATLQQLVNEWRSTDSDISRVATFEDQLMQWLLSSKNQSSDHSLNEETAGTSKLLMSVMTKKLNEKYSGVLSEQQKDLVKAYALTTATNDSLHITSKLEEIRRDLSQSIDSYLQEVQTLPHLTQKLQEMKTDLDNEDFNSINDALITKFMVYSKLKTELDSKE